LETSKLQDYNSSLLCLGVWQRGTGGESLNSQHGDSTKSHKAEVHQEAYAEGPQRKKKRKMPLPNSSRSLVIASNLKFSDGLLFRYFTCYKDITLTVAEYDLKIYYFTSLQDLKVYE
jgi:hypothetical protein